LQIKIITNKHKYKINHSLTTLKILEKKTVGNKIPAIACSFANWEPQHANRELNRYVGHKKHLTMKNLNRR